jgi:hypothetical protein
MDRPGFEPGASPILVTDTNQASIYREYSQRGIIPGLTTCPYFLKNYKEFKNVIKKIRFV